MPRFDYVLFDLDNTLFDFSASESYSLKATLENYGYDFSQDVLNVFREINQRLWAKYDGGEVTHEQVRYGRFEQLFSRLIIRHDYREAGDLFVSYLRERNDLVPNSVDVLKELSGHCNLAIVTNGFSKTQHSRLDRSPITKFFSHVFISDEIGAQKPNIEFFDFVLSTMDIKDKEKTLIIGDSLKSDVLGGKNAGIKTCWYNPKQEDNHSSIRPNFEIEKLTDLVPIVL